MLRFAANISTLFTEVPFLDRFALAREAGFRAVECQFPYVADKAEIAAALAANGLDMVLHNMPPGDWRAGDRGIGAVPGRQNEFRAGVVAGIEYAKALGCPQLNCLAGVAPQGADRPSLRRLYCENLRFAAEKCREAGICLLIEPINSKDVPDFFLDSVELANELIDEVGSTNVFLQYDIYHRQRDGGDLIGTFRELQHRIAHIQIADAPGRHEPGTGDIDFATVFATLDEAGYDGWIGCEYFPLAGTSAGLGWLKGLL